MPNGNSKPVIALALFAIALQVIVCAMDGRWCFWMPVAEETCPDVCCPSPSNAVTRTVVVSAFEMQHRSQKDSDCCLDQQPEFLATTSDLTTTALSRLAQLDRSSIFTPIRAQSVEWSWQRFRVQQPPGLAIVRATVFLI